MAIPNNSSALPAPIWFSGIRRAAPHYERTGETEATGGDTVRQAALSIIGQAVSQGLVSDNAETQDFVAIVRQNLAGMNAQLPDQLKQLDKKKAKIEKNAKRWKRKADRAGPDVIAQIVLSQVVEVERAKAAAEHQVQIHAAAIEILDDYEYDYKPEVPQASAYRYKGDLDLGYFKYYKY